MSKNMILPKFLDQKKSYYKKQKKNLESLNFINFKDEESSKNHYHKISLSAEKKVSEPQSILHNMREDIDFRLNKSKASKFFNESMKSSVNVQEVKSLQNISTKKRMYKTSNSNNFRDLNKLKRNESSRDVYQIQGKRDISYLKDGMKIMRSKHDVLRSLFGILYGESEDIISIESQPNKDFDGLQLPLKVSEENLHHKPIMSFGEIFTNNTNPQISRYFEEYKERLKKGLPNLDTQAPPAREEAIYLENWLKIISDEVVCNQSIQLKDKFLLFDKVIQESIKTLIDQVSVECKERGQILHKIIKIYESLFRYFCQEETNSLSSSLESKFQEISLLKAQIERSKEERHNDIIKRERKIISHEEEILILNEKLENAVKKSDKYESQCHNLKNNQSKYLELLKKLKKENEALREMLKNYRGNSEISVSLSSESEFNERNIEFGISLGFLDEEDPNENNNAFIPNIVPYFNVERSECGIQCNPINLSGMSTTTTQTNLILINQLYDPVLSNQFLTDEAIQDLKLKRDLNNDENYKEPNSLQHRKGKVSLLNILGNFKKMVTRRYGGGDTDESGPLAILKKDSWVDFMEKSKLQEEDDDDDDDDFLDSDDTPDINSPRSQISSRKSVRSNYSTPRENKKVDKGVQRSILNLAQISDDELNELDESGAIKRKVRKVTESATGTDHFDIQKSSTNLDKGKFTRPKGHTTTTKLQVKGKTGGKAGLNKSGTKKGKKSQMNQDLMSIINTLEIETQKNTFFREKNREYLKFIYELLKHCRNLMLIIRRLDKNFNVEDIRRRIIYIKNKITSDGNYEQIEKLEKSKEAYEREANKQKTIIRNQQVYISSVPPLSNVSIPYIDRSNNSGMILSKKIQEMASIKTSNAYIQPKNLLKIISHIYDDKISAGNENPIVRDLELPIFVFNQLVNRHGIKKVAEKKYLVLSLSCKRYCENLRINLFSRLIGIMDDRLNLGIEEARKYFEGIDYLLNVSNSGIPLPLSDPDSKRIVPFARALDLVKHMFEGKISQDEIVEIRKDLDRIKENDSKLNNKMGLIDIDMCLLKLIDKYKVIMQSTKLYVINAFRAADLDGNQICNYLEFILLFRHIESSKYTDELGAKIFEENADIFQEKSKSLSFDKFASICLDNDLFSEGTQTQFIELDKHEGNIEKTFEESKNAWEKNKEEFEERLKELKPFLDENNYFQWQSILSNLDNKMYKCSDDYYVATLIAIKIVKLELDRLETLRLEKEKEFEENEFENNEISQTNL